MACRWLFPPAPWLRFTGSWSASAIPVTLNGDSSVIMCWPTFEYPFSACCPLRRRWLAGRPTLASSLPPLCSPAQPGCCSAFHSFGAVPLFNLLLPVPGGTRHWTVA